MCLGYNTERDVHILNESATCVAANSDVLSVVPDTRLLFHKNGKRLIPKRFL